MILSEIIDKTRLQLNSVSIGSDFTDPEIKSFINDAIERVALILEQPTDYVEVSVQEGYNVHNLVSDTLMIKHAYFGRSDTAGGMKKLKIVTQATLSSITTSWLENVAANYGEPEYLMLYNRRQVLIYPTPNAANATGNHKLAMTYVYTPGRISGSGDTPDIPLQTHQYLDIYAMHLAYMGKLNNPTLGQALLSDFDAKIKTAIKPLEQVEKRMDIPWEVTPYEN